MDFNDVELVVQSNILNDSIGKEQVEDIKENLISRREIE